MVAHLPCVEGVPEIVLFFKAIFAILKISVTKKTTTQEHFCSCMVIFLFAPLEGVTQNLLVIVNP